MPLTKEGVDRLVDQVSEKLSIELKDWIDPDSMNGKAKIIKNALAMRNNDGGFLLIGFNDADGSPNIEGAPEDVAQKFHIDKIQGYVTKYSSEPFEVFLHYPEISGQTFVVIEIPQGIKTPVATKSGLSDDEKHYINIDEVFVRTLNANNTASTARAKWKDWPKLVERCFDNREADVGRFIRRHLSGALSDELVAHISMLKGNVSEVSATESSLKQFLNESIKRYDAAVQKRKLTIPLHGSMEVAVAVVGEINNYSANREFLNLITATNPQYTGWPVWVDSRSFAESNDKPYVFNGAWEAFVFSTGGFDWDHLDFWRLSPAGYFYLYRALQDDIGGGEKAPQPCTKLDFGLAVLRVAECIAVAIQFAKAMGASNEASIEVIIRWKGLSDRVISAWANPDRILPYGGKAHQDEVTSIISIPVETPPSALSTYVHQLTSELFEVFDGFELSIESSEDLVRRLIERRLY